MLPLKRILVPVDWTEQSGRALQVAAKLAQEHNALLITLYVLPIPVMMYGPAPEDYYRHLHEELCRLTPTNAKLRVRSLMAEGDPASVILKVAGENNCDLIVMGTHGRTGLCRLMMGSVAQEVARKAPCPVLTVKAETPAELVGQT